MRAEVGRFAPDTPPRTTAFPALVCSVYGSRWVEENVGCSEMKWTKGRTYVWAVLLTAFAVRVTPPLRAESQPPREVPTQGEKKMAADDRVGVPIIIQKEFRTSVVVVFTGKTTALRGMQVFRKFFGSQNPDELALDDSTPEAPVYFFDVKTSHLVNSGESAGYSVVLSLFGLDGASHPALETLKRRGHVFVYVSDLDEADATNLLGEFKASLEPTKRNWLYFLSTTGKGRSMTATLQAIQEDVSIRAR
jgi:hypothetical protein